VRTPRPQGFPKIAAQLFGRPLAITQHHAEIMARVFDEKMGLVSSNVVNGVALESRAIVQRVAEVERQALARDATFDREARKSYRMDGNIAVIEIDGVLVHKGGWLDAACGFVGYNYLLSMLEEALHDPDVFGIWLEMNSPGGAVAGLFQFIDEMAQMTAAAGGKPIYAWVNEMACSACYVILSICDKAYAPVSATVGSIGCIATLRTINRALDEAGVDIEIFRSRPRKGRGGPYEAMDDETRARIQRSVDEADDIMSNIVAAGRSLTLDALDDMAGDFFEGEEAVQLGLLDALSTEREAWAKLEDEVDRIKREKRSAL
jgi:signal peptide peptidase SppA